MPESFPHPESSVETNSSRELFTELEALKKTDPYEWGQRIVSNKEIMQKMLARLENN
jgi:hypothetical protein